MASSRPSSTSGDRKPSRITAEVQCPVCLEVPLGDIVQCVNGCTVCQPCQEKTGQDSCGQCRGRMKTPEGVWIRSRTREKMLDKMVNACHFQDKGCKEVLPRGELRQHLEDCDKSGNVIRICEHFLDGENCDFKINRTKPQEAFKHFQDHHKGCRYTGHLISLGKHLPNKINYPVLVTTDEEDNKAHCLLVIAADLDDDAVHFLALRLDKAEESIRMKISIKRGSDKVTDLILEIPVVPFVDAPAAFQKPRLVRLSKTLLDEQFRDGDTGKIKLAIKILAQE